MKILIIGNYQLDECDSMFAYAESLRHGLSSEGHQVKLIAPRVIMGRLLPRSHPFSKWLGYVDRFVIFPLSLRIHASDYDVLHVCDQSNAVYLHALDVSRRVLTCHDLFGIKSAAGLVPENTRVSSRREKMRMNRNFLAMKSAQQIICVSDKTRNDLVELLGYAPKNLQVIHNSLNRDFSPLDSAKSRSILGALSPHIRDNYIMHIGGNQWYKNRLGVMAIYCELKRRPGFEHLQLVMAGKPWTPEMRAFQIQNELTEAIEVVAPSHEQLLALYSAAYALLFPSLQEGFGWPIIEAQACGCPVITSNRAPMTEVAGNSAVFIDPDNPELAADVITASVGSFDRLREAGFDNVKRFVPENIIRQYIQTYRRICAGDGTAASLAPRT